MKTFSELLLELREAVATKRKPFDSVAFDAKQKAKYGSSMAKAAADALAAAQRKKAAAATPSREPFPWMQKGNIIPGWWHPTKGWFSFGLNKDGYHITQLLKNIGKFGIPQGELLKAAEEEAERGFYDNKSRAKQGLPHVDGKEILRMIEREYIDNAHPISMLAYKRGWLRVYGGKFHMGERGGTIEGSDRKSLKAAVREIEQVAASEGIDDIRIDVSEHLPGRMAGFPKMNVLSSKVKRDAYMKG